MRLSPAIVGALIFIAPYLLSGCEAVVPLESTIKDAEAKSFRTVPNKSNIYVIRTCAYGQKLHDVSLNGGVRISLACHTFSIFSINPGEHKLAVFSSENRDMLKVDTLAACRRAIFSERKISHLQGACSQSAPVSC